MANKRMFSLSVVDTDAFLEMPQSSQLLYFHLSMRADDEGFVASPKKIMKMVGSGEDDYKVLVVKKFIIPFESGVCVIKHWLIHNTIRLDRYSGTNYIKEKNQLLVKDNKAYKLINIDNNRIGIPNGNHLATQVKLNEVKLSKDNSEQGSQISALTEELLKSFKYINPSYKKWFRNKTQISSANSLIKEFGFEKVKKVIMEVLPKTNTQPRYEFPYIDTPDLLYKNWGRLSLGIKNEDTPQVYKLA